MLKNNIKQNINIDKIPKLRFDNFSGKWSKKSLNGIGLFLKGGDISRSDISINGKYKCIRYGELYTEYNEIITDIKSRTNKTQDDSFLNNYGDVIFPSSGETSLDMARFSCVHDNNVLLGGGLNIIRPNEDNDGAFWAYYLSNHKKRDIARLAQGHSVVHLYNSHLENLNVSVPSLSEQQNISNFLISIDSYIENLKKQKNNFSLYKRGIIQNIFFQEIRFKDDNGKDFPVWKEKKLKDCLSYEQPTPYLVESVEYDSSYKIPVLTAGKTFILGYTNETNGVYMTSKLPVIIFDDFTTASQFVDFQFKVKSSAMKILQAKQDIDIKFLYEAMQLIKYKIGGHGRHWISKYSNIKILMPIFLEQKKIAEFINSIDRLIELKQEQIIQAEQWKKGLMQSLFV